MPLAPNPSQPQSIRQAVPSRRLQIGNFVIFQLAWFAAVVGAAHDRPLWGTAVVAAAIAWHLGVATRPREEGKLVASVALIGFVAETIIANQGNVVYASGQPVSWLAPYWMVALWALLAISLNVTMRWLKGRLVFAAVLGAVAGPAAFSSGVRLGGARFVDAQLALVEVGAMMAVLIPVVVRLSSRFDGVVPTPRKADSGVARMPAAPRW